MSGPVVAIGGAELSLSPENEALHDYVTGLARERAAGRGRGRPAICLLPTASGDPEEQIGRFRAASERRGCEPSAVSLFRLGEERVDLAAHLPAQDAIYVTGGNMVNLMALWREHGLDRILRAAHAGGTVLCGYSAGSMCWFEHGVSRGSGDPVATRGLGLIGGSHCVHYSQDPERRAVYRELVGAGELPPGLALDDHAAALFRDGELVEAVRSSEPARARRVTADGSGGVVEQPVAARLLSPAPRGADDGAALQEMRALRAHRRR